MSDNYPARLVELLDEALKAEPSERIEYRDPIAACGPSAVAAMTQWLKDGTHTGFAIRTLERVGESDDPLLADLAVRTMRRLQPSVEQPDQELIKRSLRRLGEPEKAPVAEPDFRLYDRLIEAARAGDLLAYSEVGAPAGLDMGLSYHRRIIGQMLGKISRRETGAGRPMLSSIVVHKGKTEVGDGFYLLGQDLEQVREGEDAKAFGARQQRETFEFWASHPEAGPLD
jgi:hypothetical protein